MSPGRLLLFFVAARFSLSCGAPEARAQSDIERPALERDALDVPVRLELPEHFRPLPGLASAVEAAAAKASDIRLETWAFGDPSAGSYALVGRLHTPSAGAAQYAALRDHLLAAGVAVHALESGRAAPARLGFNTERMAGQVGLAARDADPSTGAPVTIAIACFHEQRRAPDAVGHCDRLFSILEVGP